MLHHAVLISDALRTASAEGRLRDTLIPAMFGCPECHTAWVIASPDPLGSCRDCGQPLAVLSTAQASAVFFENRLASMA